MIVIGKGYKANGLYGTYSLTNSSDAITNATLSVINLAEDYYNNKGLSTEIKAMRDESEKNDSVDTIFLFHR